MGEQTSVIVERFELDEGLECEKDPRALAFRYPFSRPMDDEELQELKVRLEPVLQLPRRGIVEINADRVVLFAYAREAQLLKDRINAALESVCVELFDRRSLEEQKRRAAAEERRRLIEEGRRAVATQR